MNQRINVQQMIPLLLVLMVGVFGFLTLVLSNIPAIQIALDLPRSQLAANKLEAFDSERAADVSAMRWQAMANYYKEQDLLTRDDFDYEQEAEISVMRWQAMANYYEEHGLLTRDAFDYEQAAEISAMRWQAMARFYEKNGLLNAN